jgi:hypothetical protein
MVAGVMFHPRRATTGCVCAGEDEYVMSIVRCSFGNSEM